LYYKIWRMTRFFGDIRDHTLKSACIVYKTNLW